MELGHPGIYHAHKEHHTEKTVKHEDREDTIEGSIHHSHMRSFAAIVGRVHPAHKDADGKKHPLRVDVAFFVPGRPHFEWVHGVEVGEGHGEFEPEEEAETKSAAKNAAAN